MFIQCVQIAAYLPNARLVSVYLDHVLEAAGEEFSKYFRKEFLREMEVDGRKALLPLFWCGDRSPARAGHPASQNLAEHSIGLIKNILEKRPKDELTFLRELEKRCGLTTEAPSGERGFLGESQELALAPLPLGQMSPDLLSGRASCSKSCFRSVLAW